MAEVYVPATHLSAVPNPPDSRARALTPQEQTTVAVVAALVGALGLLGFVNSFARVTSAARTSFGALAFTLPIGIDLGIAVFSALDIVLARLDMRLRWLRTIPWSLTAATVYLNVAGERSAFGIVAHAMLPALWVAAVEVAAHVARTRAGLAAGSRMDSIRLSRWLLAPGATVRLWRRMVLWETRSYPAALRRERDRVLALTDLQDSYGRVAWRWKAPRRTKALYKLGEFTPANLSVLPTVPDRQASATQGERGRTTDSECRTSRTADGTKRRTGTRTKRRTVPNVDDLIPTGRSIAATLGKNGVPLTRDSLAVALRKAGQSAGNERVGELLTRLKNEPARTDIATDVDGDPR